MYQSYYTAPFGILELTADDCALTACRRVAASGPETPNAVTAKAAAELKEYFAENRKEFTVALCPQGTAFQKSVWDALVKRPFGETTHYGALARELSNPNASRAVGGAVGKNPILIFIPCHRVLRAEGRLGGFSAGLDAKKILLALESIPWKP